MPIITEAKKIEEILSRGVENIYPDKESLKKKLMSGERLKLYCGFDPTGPELHLGHGAMIRKLDQFRRLGHEVIFLYGGFTAMIGDPTDRAQTRKSLTAAQVKTNMRGWKSQIRPIIDVRKIHFKNNADWLSKLKLEKLLEIAACFTAQQMLAREMFQKRLAEGRDLYLTEFMYPLMQAFDSVAMDVDLEIGGNDQMFNMLAGRTLVKKITGKEKFVLTTKLLTDPSGAKMGKTEGNMVTLTDSAEDMFGKVMSWSDELIVPALEILTDVPMELIKDIGLGIKSGDLNPRDVKLNLAYEVTKIYLGEAAAEKGKANFKRVVQDKDKPEEIKETKVDFEGDEIGVLDLFVKAGLAKSTSEARRLIGEKAIRIDDVLVELADLKIKIPEQGLLLQRGKRQFVRVRK
jgi:tyrosyl-tRNA synthetase